MSDGITPAQAGAADHRAVILLSVAVELRRVLDLILRRRDAELLLVAVNAFNNSHGKGIEPEAVRGCFVIWEVPAVKDTDD
jgi:hypothetical protein